MSRAGRGSRIEKEVEEEQKENEEELQMTPFTPPPCARVYLLASANL